MQVSWSRARQAGPAEVPAQREPAPLADWLARFWALDQHQPFTAPETRLYCYWLHRFHAAGWPAWLPGREQLVAAQLNLSTKVFATALAGLARRGLLALVPALDGSVPHWVLVAPTTLTTSTTPVC